jgi:AraC-like DNA-binding protein
MTKFSRDLSPEQNAHLCRLIMRRFSQIGSRIVRDPRSAQRYPRNMLVALPVPKPLSAFVDGIWTHTGSTRPYRVLPDGCLDFIFSLESGTASVVGPMSRAIVVPARSGVTFFGVRFRPGRAARFLDTHASELSDEQAALSTITRLATLAERIAEARDDHQRTAAILSTLLDARCRTRAADARVERAVTLIGRAAGHVSVPAVAASVGLGERQLERRFLERVGMGPKRLARIMRFERAWHLLQRGGSQAEVAALAGYSDEPHLLRDFRALAGVAPRGLQEDVPALGARCRIRPSRRHHLRLASVA